ncbi:hypothetical protein SDC9_210286 [bioreactor metagenome]|uniref:Uncharacterized protein n=1 Tax=bioreactor metagenome TaxID=1076179 RepID=A0A645JGQ8_9ZZZZ
MPGIATETSFWATKKIELSDFSAKSKASIDLSRATEKLIIILGKTVNPLKGIIGKLFSFSYSIFVTSCKANKYL